MSMMRKPSPLTWFAILLILTNTLALVLPPSPEVLRTIHISAAEYRVITFTLILPYAIIWFSAFYAYAKLQQYAQQLQITPEGKAFRQIANGVGIMAWGLAIPALLSMMLGAIAARYAGFTATRTIVSNYAILLVPLISFTLIGNGTRSLTEIVRARPSLAGTRSLVFVFIVIGVLFSYFVIHNSNVHHSAYYLPLYALIITIIMPYLYAWFVGFLSAYELRLYAQKTKGVLYRQALIQLAGGITIAIVGSVCLQYLDGVYVGNGNLSLNSFLIIIYSLLIIQGVGYALIALGSKRLKRIEEV
jgi:hypothetical protein